MLSLSHFSPWRAGIQKSILTIRVAIDFRADLQMHELQLFDRMCVIQAGHKSLKASTSKHNMRNLSTFTSGIQKLDFVSIG
jgi:hypothetical protein